VTQTFISAGEKKHEGPNRITKKESVIEKFQWEQTQTFISSSTNFKPPLHTRASPAQSD